jgi:hypothetical protein
LALYNNVDSNSKYRCEGQPYFGRSNLTLIQIERMLGDNGILENPRLLDMMDDNLSISIADLCLYYKMTKNTVFREQNIVEVTGT